MARRDSDGESKQGLVIALVAFVILFVLTAVIAFLGYSDAKSYSDQLDAKTNERKSARDKSQVKRPRVGNSISPLSTTTATRRNWTRTPTWWPTRPTSGKRPPRTSWTRISRG